MVQFKRAVYDTQRECRDYWKLTPAVGMRAFLLEALEQRDVKSPKGLSKARLSCISLRVQRGLMVYDSRSVSELRSFAANRKLDIPDLARCKKVDLIAHLEKADEKATFTLFEDLPAELRVHIYEVHLQDLRADRILPVPAPITRVSRLLRQESLPLFYQICKFEASLNASGCSDHATRRFFSQAPLAVLEGVRELHVLGAVAIWSGSIYRYRVVKFTLCNAGDDLDITDGQNPSDREPLLEAGLQVLRKRVQDSGIPSRDDKLRLRRSDINALDRVFRSIWPSN